MNEQDHRIHSPELAHHMGYAEYPYHELAIHALKLGLDKKHEEHMKEAHEASMTVLREHVQSVQDTLDHLQEENKEKHPSQNEEGELFKDVTITKAEFYNLASELDKRENGNSKGMAGRVWVTLKMLAETQEDPTANPGYIRWSDWSKKTHLKYLSASHDAALDFGSLVTLFEETTPQEWLDITNFGEAKHTLLHEVIERKKAEVLTSKNRHD